MSFQINFELSAETQKAFTDIQNKFSIKGFAPIAIEQLKEDSSFFFFNEVDPLGDEWVPSARAIEENNKTLHMTGNMEENMQETGAYKIEEHLFGAYINVISKYDYAKKHQFGKGKKLAQRTFSGLKKDSPDKIFSKYSLGF